MHKIGDPRHYARFTFHPPNLACNHAPTGEASPPTPSNAPTRPASHRRSQFAETQPQISALQSRAWRCISPPITSDEERHKVNGRYWLRLQPEPGKKYWGLMGHFRNCTKEEVITEIKKAGVLSIVFIKHDGKTEDERSMNKGIIAQEMLEIWNQCTDQPISGDQMLKICKAYQHSKSQKTPRDTRAPV